METKTPPSKRPNRRLLWTLLLAAPLLMGAGALCVIWYWNANKDEIIRTKLEEAIRERTNGMYAIKYDSSNVNELEGNLSFYNLKLNYDSIKFLNAQKAGVAPPVLFSVTIPEISVSGVKTSRAMAKNEIIGKKLVIREPVIDLFYTYEGKDAERNLPTEEDYREILSGLNLVEVDTVLLSKASVRTKNKKTGRLIAEGNDINITLVNVKIDSAAFYDKTRMMFSRDVDIKIGKVNWVSNDKLYNFNIGNISLTSATKTLRMEGFAMKPTMGEQAFVNAKKYQDDRIDLSIAGISVSGVDAKRILEEDLFGSTMILQSPSVKFYRDLGRPRDNKNRVGHYPHQVLDHIPFDFVLNKVLIRNGYIEYKQRHPETRESGNVRFHNVNGTIGNFDNTEGAAGKVMSVDLNSRFLDQTSFNTKWRLYLGHPKGKFSVTGKLGTIQGVQLNVLTEPLGPSHIREGVVDGLDFSLEGTDYDIRGNVQVLYRDLKIDLLELDKGESKTDKKFLTSLLANMIIKNANPKPGEEIRRSVVNIQRDVNKSMFNLCWKAIFKGIRESVGIKQDVKIKT